MAKWMEIADRQESECTSCGRQKHRYHDCTLNPVADPCPDEIAAMLGQAGWERAGGLWYHASIGDCSWIEAVVYCLAWFGAHYSDAR